MITRVLENATIEKENLSKVNKKTNTEINLHLNPTAQEILSRYNNKLPQFANAYLNRTIKDILRKHDLLKTEYKKTTIKNRQEITIKGLKRDFVTIHKSRSTCITLLINQNVPLSEIMPITGHKLVSTLNAYADKKINPEVTNKISI